MGSCRRGSEKLAEPSRLGLHRVAADDAAALVAIRCRAAGSCSRRRQNSAMAPASPGGTSATLSPNVARVPPTSLQTTGIPSASASMIVCGTPSDRDGTARASACR